MTHEDELHDRRQKRIESGAFYPVVLVGPERSALVVGGGAVATRKVRGLLEGGFGVTVLSPEITDELRQLHASGAIGHVPGSFPDGAPEVGIFNLIFAATNHREANRAVARAANAAGVPVNVADDPEGSDFFTTAVIRHPEEGVLISISTFGQSPGRAKRLRQAITAAIEGVDWEAEGGLANLD